MVCMKSFHVNDFEYVFVDMIGIFDEILTKLNPIKLCEAITPLRSINELLVLFDRRLGND